MLVTGVAPPRGISDLRLRDTVSACVAARKALDRAFISSGYFGSNVGVESARGLGLAIAPVAAIKERCLFSCDALLGAGGACRLLLSFCIAKLAAELPNPADFGLGGKALCSATLKSDFAAKTAARAPWALC